MGRVLAPRVPLDNEVHLLFEVAQPVLQGVVGAVLAHQQRQFGQAPGPRQDALPDVAEFLLTVLLAFSQLTADAPPFGSHIGRDRRITVIAVVGARDPFLLGPGVVHGKDIDVHRHMTGLERTDRCLGVDHELDIGLVNDLPQDRCVLVKTLPQRFWRGYPLQPQRLAEQHQVRQF